MKIAILGQCLIGDNIKNGVKVHVYNLAKALSVSNEVHVIALGSANKVITDGYLKIHVIKCTIGNVPSPIDIIKIRKKVLDINPEVVHAHESWYPYSTTLLILSKKYKKVVTIHGNLKYETKCFKGVSFAGYLGGFVAIINEILVLHFIKNVIIVSNSFKEYINLDKHNVTMIPNGFNLSDESFIKSNFNNDLCSDVFFIGKISKRKGIDILIKAIPIIKNKYPAIKVFVAGTGPMEENIVSLLDQYSLNNNVKLLGNITDMKKYECIKSSKICVTPSRFEPFGIVILEAMACGKPVVASNVGGIPEIIENNKNGLLFDVNNESQLAKCITYLLDNEKISQTLGHNGHNTIHEKYQWKIIAEQTLEWYNKLLIF